MQTDNVQLFLDYLREIRNYKPISLKKMKTLLTKIEICLNGSLLEATKASQIETAIVGAVLLRKMDYNGGFFDSGQHTKFRMGLAAAQYLRYAYGEGLISKNVYPRNTFRRPPKREAGWLTDEDLQAILNNDKLNVFEHAMIRFMIDTAIRREEFMKAKIADCDFVERTIHIPEGKADGFRTVPFTERTLFWIETYLSMRKVSSEYLFSANNGEQLSYQAIGTHFQYISQKLGYRVHAHKLRHTAGRLWAEAGVNQGLIMQFMGHVDPRITAQYIHTSTKKLKELQAEVYEKNAVLCRKS